MNDRKISAPAIDTGIAADERAMIAAGLSRLLADNYTLYLKTHNFHWNVTGPMFNTLHLMFEQQYNELALAVDLIAERIRALGFPAPGTYREFADLSSIRESQGVPAAERMIRERYARFGHRVERARFLSPVLDRPQGRECLPIGLERLHGSDPVVRILRRRGG